MSVDYVFTPQGNIKLRVGATGFDAIKSVKAKDMEAPSAAKDETTYGNLIAPYTMLHPFHDHYFNFRLDLDVDGPQEHPCAQHIRIVDAAAEGPRKSMWVPQAPSASSRRGLSVEDHTSDSRNGQLLRLTNPKQDATG